MMKLRSHDGGREDNEEEGDVRSRSSSRSSSLVTDNHSNERTPRNKSDRLVRYLSENHDWHSYSNDEELFVQEFPKIELHVHLDGTFDPDFLWQYMKDQPESVTCLPVGVDLPWETSRTLPVRALVSECKSAREFHNLCTCRGNRSLKAMLNCFEIFMPLVRRNLDLIEQLAYDFCQRQFEQNIVYTEVRYSPHFLAESFQEDAAAATRSKKQQSDDKDGTGKDDVDPEPVDAEAVFQAVTKGLRRGCSQFKITVNQILCAMTWRPDWAMSTLDLVKRHRHDGPCPTVGIDVASGEEHFDYEQYPKLYRPHREMLLAAKRDKIPITIHAGESVDARSLQNVKVAVHEYEVSRIGHGYRLIESEELMRDVRTRNVHVEVCPTSSVETGGWIFKEDGATGGEEKNWLNHPCRTMKEYGVSFSLSSDDPAVFHTSLAWQYRIALAKMDFTREEVLATNLRAIEAAFCSDVEKDRLRNIVTEYGEYKRLKVDVAAAGVVGSNSSNTSSDVNSSAHSFSTTGNADVGRRRKLFRTSLSDSFTDRVYVSKSQYF